VLAARGRYHDALRAAVAANFDDQCKRLPSDELLLLGDVARLDGDTARASHAYDVALTRFPDADRTTFALGVVAFESRHDYADAARWFDRYLHEHPRGPLATAAAGRLMESYSRGGDAARARTAARAYLREHPQGPHAALARRIASGS
jgi:TolA-binding protein